MTANGSQVSCWGDENVLKLIVAIYVKFVNTLKNMNLYKLNE